MKRLNKLHCWFKLIYSLEPLSLTILALMNCIVWRNMVGEFLNSFESVLVVWESQGWSLETSDHQQAINELLQTHYIPLTYHPNILMLIHYFLWPIVYKGGLILWGLQFQIVKLAILIHLISRRQWVTDPYTRWGECLLIRRVWWANHCPPLPLGREGILLWRGRF